MLDVQQPAGQLLSYMNQNMDVLLLLKYSSTVTLSIRAWSLQCKNIKKCSNVSPRNVDAVKE